MNKNYLIVLAVWVVHAFAIMVVSFLLPGIHVTGLGGAFISALILGLLNALVKPVLVLLTLPLTVLSLGIFYFVLNALMFYSAGHLLDSLTVDGFWWALFASLIYSIVATLLTHLFLRPKVKIERV